MMASTSDLVAQVRQAADLLRSAKYAVALTGAGYSTPSGIPDFRSSNSGIWEKVDPFEVASLMTFRYHPEKFYKWFHRLASTIFTAEPNPAHFALAALEQAGWIKAVITQNIDTLHQKAGAHTVYEVHGTLQTMTCIQCFYKDQGARYIEAYLRDGTIPLCPNCRGTLKPDVILFEEQLPIHTWLDAETACQKCDALLIAGSSLVVMPVAGLPARAAEHGANVIVINRTPTYMDSRASVLIQADLVDVMPMLAQEVLGA